MRFTCSRRSFLIASLTGLVAKPVRASIPTPLIACGESEVFDRLKRRYPLVRAEDVPAGTPVHLLTYIDAPHVAKTLHVKSVVSIDSDIPQSGVPTLRLTTSRVAQDSSLDPGGWNIGFDTTPDPEQMAELITLFLQSVD